MKWKLGVAVLSRNQELLEILKQIGVMTEEFAGAHSDGLDEYLVWVVEGGKNSSATAAVRRHLVAGGGILTIGGEKSESCFSLFGTGHELFDRGIDLLCVGRASFERDSRIGETRPGRSPFARDEGTHIAIPAISTSDIKSLRIPFRWKDKVFSERCRAYDRGGYRRLMRTALSMLFSRLDYPLVTKSIKVSGKLPFLVRIDADGYDRGAAECALDLSSQARTPFTWFIDVERHEPHDLMQFVELLLRSGQEVQSHSWHHFVYGLEALDQANLRRSLERLRLAGALVTGFCAPFGFWNQGLQRAVDRLQLSFSSEFSFAWDDLPAWPNGSHALQIPIHPVCPALLLDAGCDESAVRDYFSSYTKRQLSRGEPAAVYFHPIGDIRRATRAIRELLDEISGNEAFIPMTFSSFDRGWRFRDSAKLYVESTDTHDAVVRCDCEFEVSSPRRPTVPTLAGADRVATWERAALRSLRAQEWRRLAGMAKTELLRGKYTSLAAEIVKRA